MSSDKLIWKTLVDAYHNSVELLTINLLWALFTVLLITAPGAQAGLYYSTNLMASGRSISVHTFFVGFRKYWWASWSWSLINLVVFVILGYCYFFYRNVQQTWADIFQMVVGIILVIWLLVQIYTFPLILEQDTPRFWLAVKNSFVLYLQMPAYGLGLAVFLVCLFILSTVLRLPWLLFTASLAAFLTNRFVLFMLSSLLPRKLQI